MRPLPKVWAFSWLSSFSLTSAPAQEELIKELTTQIARLTPMFEQGRGSTVHFLTREAADEEKRVLEERLEKAKEALRQQDAITKDKDARIAALNEQCT
jgi:phage-related minor tail protein